jgi:hypothetical protein
MNNATISDNFKPMSMESITSIDSGVGSSASLSASLASSGSSSSVWGYIKSISFTTWLIIFLVLNFIFTRS